MDIATLQTVLNTRLKIANSEGNYTEASLLYEILKMSEELKQYREELKEHKKQMEE